MKTLFCLLCLLVLPSAASAASVALSNDDQAAIRAAALDYAEGWYSGDRSRMQRALHPQLAKRAYLPHDDERQLDEMGQAALLQATAPGNAERYATAARRAEVEILDGFGHVATVKLQMDDWVDYLHVARDETGQWRILNVLWELGQHP